MQQESAASVFVGGSLESGQTFADLGATDSSVPLERLVDISTDLVRIDARSCDRDVFATGVSELATKRRRLTVLLESWAEGIDAYGLDASEVLRGYRQSGLEIAILLQDGRTVASSDAHVMHSEGGVDLVLTSAEVRNVSPDDEDLQGLDSAVVRRIRQTVSCHDTDLIPKVAGAGRCFDVEGTRVQRMFNGLDVVADGYYGDFITPIVRRLRGHHEPQEELVVHEVIERLRSEQEEGGLPRPTCLEPGAFWAYYSMWFCGMLRDARSVATEPDGRNLAVGRRNIELNDLSEAVMLLPGVVGGGPPGSDVTFTSEDGLTSYTVPVHDVASMMAAGGFDHVDILFCDIQGAELDLLDRTRELIAAGAIRFVVVSTHHRSISGSALTHQDCLRLIQSAGGWVVAEHSVAESASGDGLIVASFSEADRGFVVDISYQRSKDSLFGELEYEVESALTGVPAEAAVATSGTPNGVRTYFAQNREDLFIEAFFPDVAEGFYVDIGASDPVVDSVTKLFYDRGWHGINVEPIRERWLTLQADRPRDLNINAGVAGKSGSMTFHEYPNADGRSTFSPELASDYETEADFDTRGATAYEVPVTTLADVIKDNDVPHIHFLKIDVEGFEYEVIEGYDWQGVRPELLCIEADRISAERDWRPLIAQRGYELVFHDGLNNYYLASEAMDRAQHFNYADVALNTTSLRHDVAMFFQTKEGELERSVAIVQSLTAELADLRDELARTASQVAWLHREVAARDADVTHLAGQVEWLHREVAIRDEAAVEREALIEQLRATPGWRRLRDATQGAGRAVRRAIRR